MDSKVKFLFSAAAAIVLGGAILLLADVKLKYLAAFCLLIFFPFFVQHVGSPRKAFMAVLIFSLSTQMSFNPFYSDYYARTDMGFRISLTLLVLIAAYLVWFFECVTKKKAVQFFPKVTVPLFILVAWCGISYIFSRKPDFTVFLFTQATVGFFVYFYAANFIESKEDVRYIIRCAAVTVLITGLIAIAQYFKPDFLNLKFMGWSDEPLKLHYGSKVIVRPSAFLGHANNLAAFLVSWLPLLFIILIASAKRLIPNLWEAGAFVCGSCALVLTFSRGGWLTFVFAIGVILILLNRRHVQAKLPDLVPRILILGVVGIFILLPFTPQVIQRLTRDDYGAGASRITLAKNALEVFVDEPVIGVGLGYYLDFVPIPPHNMYLQTAVEQGMIGLVLFLWVSWGFFRSGFAALRYSHDMALLFAVGLVAGLGGAYLHGMVELGTIAYHKFLTYLFIGGLLVGLGRREIHEEKL